jgi:hypothetical protein
MKISLLLGIATLFITACNTTQQLSANLDKAQKRVQTISDTVNHVSKNVNSTVSDVDGIVSTTATTSKSIEAQVSVPLAQGSQHTTIIVIAAGSTFDDVLDVVNTLLKPMGCNPAFWFDIDGNKHYRRDCQHN